MAMPAPQAPPMGPPPMWTAPGMPMRKQRPLGVAILAVLTILFGIGGILIGLGLIALAALGAAALATAVAAGQIPAWIVGVLAVIGVVVLFFGLIGIASGLGLWRMRPWAWWLTIIVGVFSIVLNAVTFSWIGVALWLIILIYLFVVRQHFGIGAAPQPTMMPPPM